jgi:thioesterase domain-containing protein
MLAPRDRQSEAQLRYSRAMDRYAGGTFPGHLVIVRSRKLDDERADLGWTRLAASTEVHVLPGDHVTLVTRHVGEVGEVVRAAIANVLATSRLA